MGLVLLVYVPKMVLTLVLLGEDIFRMGAGSISYFETTMIIQAFSVAEKLSQVGLGLAAIPFMSLIYGITIGKYNYKVIKQRIFFLIYRMLLTVLLLHKYQMFTVAVLIIRKD
jgi:hypothetical protein